MFNGPNASLPSFLEERRNIELIKAKAIIEKEKADETIELVDMLRKTEKELNGNLDIIQEGHNKHLEQEDMLKFYSDKFGALTRCDKNNCSNGKINGYGLKSDCPSCKGYGYILIEKKDK